MFRSNGLVMSSNSLPITNRWAGLLRPVIVLCFTGEVLNAAATFGLARTLPFQELETLHSHVPGPSRLLLLTLAALGWWGWMRAARVDLAHQGIVVPGWNIGARSVVARLPTLGVLPTTWVGSAWRVGSVASLIGGVFFFVPTGSGHAAMLFEALSSAIIASTLLLGLILVHAVGRFLEATLGVTGASAPPHVIATSQAAAPPRQARGPGSMSAAPFVPRQASPPAIEPAPSPAPTPAQPVCVDCGQATPAARCPRCGASLTLGPFTAVALLGKREYARTYRARAATGQRVVVKELWLSRVPDAATLDAFDRESRVLASLRHPRLPRFIESFTMGTGKDLRLLLAMEEVEGTSLAAQVARHGPLPWNEVVHVIGQTLDLLVFLQSRQPKVFHRDVKPSNLLRHRDGKIVLVDFGVARVAESTTDGTLVGTVGYMPPEQLAGRVDETSDLYALGVTAIHLLTGVEPASRLGPDARLTMPRLDVPRPWRTFLERLAAPERRGRFPDAAVARQAFQRLVQPHSTASMSPTRLAAVVAALALLTVGGLVLARRASHRPPAPTVTPDAPAVAAPVVTKPFPEVPLEDGDAVVGTYPGGEVTVAEAVAESSRLPPLMRFQYRDYAADLVGTVGALEQLDRLAQQEGATGTTPRQRIAAFFARSRGENPRELINRHTFPVDVHRGVLARIIDRPSVWQPGPPRPTRHGSGSIGLGGEFSYSVFPRGTFIFDDFDGDFRSPREWLTVEFTADDEGDLFGRGSWAPYTPPSYFFSASGANWRVRAPPRPRPERLLLRYPVSLDAVRVSGEVTEADAREAWRRVSESMEVCLAAAAWDHQWSRTRLRATLGVSGEVLRPRMEVLVDAHAHRDVPHASARFTQPELCGLTLARWRFPSNVEGEVTYELSLSGQPWTSAEQDAAEAEDPRWFTRFTRWSP